MFVLPEAYGIEAVRSGDLLGFDVPALILPLSLKKTTRSIPSWKTISHIFVAPP